MQQEFSQEALEMIARRFRVLSEPIRLRLVNVLRNGEMSVNELTAALRTSQPNVSKHLKMLLDSGIVSREQRGNAVFYAIADETIFQLCDVVCESLEAKLRKQSKLFALV